MSIKWHEPRTPEQRVEYLAARAAWRAAHREQLRDESHLRYLLARAEISGTRKVNRTRNLAFEQNAIGVRRAFVDAVRASGCVDCGNKNLSMLQSDHVSGQKVAGIAQMVRSKAPFERLFAELEKCETRCANCHIVITAQRRKTPN